MLPKDTFDNLKAKVQMCLVRIIALSDGKPTLFAPGIVIAKKKLSCYVITDKETFSYGSKGIYAVVFPGLNNEHVAINFTGVSIADSFASFMLSKPKGTNPVAAVQICESGPLINEDVYTLGYQNPLVPTTHLSPGSVRFVGEADFVHNCATAVHADFGSPVFTIDGVLVGICFNYRGAVSVRAYKVQSITQHVLKIQARIKDKAKDMLQAFMDQKNVLLEKRKTPVDSSAGASKKSKTTR